MFQFKYLLGAPRTVFPKKKHTEIRCFINSSMLKAKIKIRRNNMLKQDSEADGQACNLQTIALRGLLDLKVFTVASVLGHN